MTAKKRKRATPGRGKKTSPASAKTSRATPPALPKPGVRRESGEPRTHEHRKWRPDGVHGSRAPSRNLPRTTIRGSGPGMTKRAYARFRHHPSTFIAHAGLRFSTNALVPSRPSGERAARTKLSAA